VSFFRHKNDTSLLRRKIEKTREFSSQSASRTPLRVRKNRKPLALRPVVPHWRVRKTKKTSSPVASHTPFLGYGKTGTRSSLAASRTPLAGTENRKTSSPAASRTPLAGTEKQEHALALRPVVPHWRVRKNRNTL
jgi:hypothetical protein